MLAPLLRQGLPGQRLKPLLLLRRRLLLALPLAAAA